MPVNRLPFALARSDASAAAGIRRPDAPRRRFGIGAAARRLPALLSIGFSLAALVMPLPASARDEASPLPPPVVTIEGITEHRLPNGLTILLGPDDAKPTMTINLVYRVGSRHEGEGEAGMAHLLEHMLFKGTEKTPDPKREFTRRGMRWNGTTSYDRTNYYAQFPAGDADRDFMLGWLADTMTNIRIDAAMLDGERPVVKNEMQANENRPQRILYQQMLATAYDFHPYGRAVIGSESDLDRVQPERLQSFYRRYYRPDNAVLIITGRMEAAATLRAAVTAFGGIARPTSPIPAPYTLDPVRQGEREVVLRRSGGVPELAVGYHIGQGGTREHAALSVLATTLTRDPDGPLYQTLVKAGLASRLWGSAMAAFDPGVLAFGATIDDGKQRDAAWQAMREQLEMALPLTEAGLKRTQQDYANYRRQLTESAESMAIALTESVAQGDWRILFARFDWIAALTTDEVRAAGRRWLLRDNRTLAWYLPTESPQRAPVPARQDIRATLDAHTFAAGDAFSADFALTPDSIQERTVTGRLPVGLRYALLPRRTKGDRVEVALWLQWGNLQNLSDRWRDADLLGRMMQSGTRSLSYQALEDRIRALDARLEISASETGAQATLEVRKNRLDEALTLVADTLRAPVFPEDLFAERKRSRISAIESNRDQPEARVADALRQAGHPYPSNDPRHYRPADAMIADLKTQDSARLAAFWRDFAGASYGQFAAVGDFDPTWLTERINQLFGDWQTPKAFERISRPWYALPPGRQLITIPDKANAVYSQTRTFPMSENHPDYVALALAVRAFGGDSGSRIAQRLREKEGLTYGAYAAFQADRKVDNAIVTIRAIHAPANLARVEAATREELQRALTDGFTAVEIDNVRNAWLQRRSQALADEGNVATQLASNLYWGDTMQRWQAIDEQIRTTSLEAVNAALRRYVRLDDALTIGAGSFPAGTPQ